ncbi:MULTISPECIES: alpha-L-fucosidase [unclassified Leeuwenhoekiella]|uniref:alpha-L-fucosidase n=1 Tax=unclassified Leeuwenhoekiella TaxID=2615029 RepID=UPI000C54B3E9|nr:MULTISPECIES: alpha-L-fucosidase [unclassified Leeuwenhoekiella]MAW94986.1 alpha-L-fucosidase [Leeuwenhoekiella sp.]MBA79706.1 alpha-L-fucosidase [Leeuwenhoekiella sp.]|tara:strand:- start:3813 stop:5144 length:1332 start_codon:yes stop_codon:yes gene_type:complete
MKKYTTLLLLLLLFPLWSQEADTLSTSSKMQWFKDAKLGIFIHWGLYAVNGIDESWSFYNGYISHEDYLKQTEGFSAKNYNPKAWADLIAESGAKYAVITSKHHDGFALWNTRYGNLNALESSAAQKDVLTPFVKALRKDKLKVGIYYSLPDWSYEDYTHFTRDSIRYSISEEPKRWKSFLNYYQGQLSELSKNYKPDLWWFDGDWEHNAEEWQAAKVKKMLLEDNKQTIINSRLSNQGDYATPEQGMPIVRPKDKYWELCMTLNNSWGYQTNDNDYKTTNQVIGIFADVIGNGGNLLLDIGPKADGTIPDGQKEILKELGRWTHKHTEAIYGTRAGIPKEHFYGPSTLNKDRNILYLFVKGNPGGEVVLRGLKNKINRIYVVGEGTKLDHQVVGKVYWSQYPGITYIKVPDYVLDENMTVLAVLLDGEVDLYREEGAVIESN